MNLTCVIVTKDRPEELARCLHSIEQQTQPANQVVVVDGSRTAEAVVQKFSSSYYQSEPGITRQRNVARSKVAVDTDIVVYCDDDTELPPDTFLKVNEFFTKHPQAVGLTGSLDQERHDSILKKLFGYCSLTYTTKPYGYTTGLFNIINQFTRAQQVSWLPGAFMCYRWNRVKAIEFDEWFADYGLAEDFDFSYRVGKLGELWADPSIVVQHHHSDLNRNWQRFGYMRIKNRNYLRKKYWPRSAKYWLGMWWANLNLLALNCLRGLVSKRYQGEFRGMIRGLLTK